MRIRIFVAYTSLWSGSTKNRDVSTGSLACLFARSLALLTRSLAHSLRSLPSSWESELLMSQNDLVLSHSARAPRLFIGFCHIGKYFFSVCYAVCILFWPLRIFRERFYLTFTNFKGMRCALKQFLSFQFCMSAFVLIQRALTNQAEN